jgi:8-oxo-dGTP pyrophosphatase MutT (NUDIX family)
MTSESRHPVIRVIDSHVARPTAEGRDTYEYLVLLRAPGRVDEGRWRIVTGKIEGAEAGWQTARREFSEETQLPLTRLFVVPYVSRYYEWEHDRLNDIPRLPRRHRARREPVLDGEHVDFRWATRDEALDLLVWPGQRDGLSAADLLLTDHHQPDYALESPSRVTEPKPPATDIEIRLTSPLPFVGTIRNS